MTLPSLRLLLVVCLLPCAFAKADAVIEGHVDLPKPHMAPVAIKRYEVVTRGGVVATDPPQAVVYLEGTFPKASPPAVAQMAQKDLAFATTLLPIQAGSRVEFPNLDSTYHNIFSYSAIKRFDLGRYRSDERPIPSQIFETAGLVTLHCDIHQHMRALILVVDTPHFTKSDTEGHYRLAGLPAGQYVLKAWINSGSTLEHPVALKSGETLHFDFP